MYHLKIKSSNSEELLCAKLSSGDNMIFVPDAKLAKDYFINGIYECNYIEWVCENFIKPGMNVIDVGANIGLYTIEMAKLSNRVYSFETCPNNYNFLCANIILRDLSYKVTTYNTALSNTTGIAKYYIRDIKHGGRNGICLFENDATIPSINIPKAKLDSFDIKNVSFIKVIAEGDEEYVLRGAVKTITENSYPPILFESCLERISNVSAKQVRESLFKFIESLGYSIIQVRLPADNMFLATRKPHILNEDTVKTE